jgi:hypothetical protein
MKNNRLFCLDSLFISNIIYYSVYEHVWLAEGGKYLILEQLLRSY